MTEFDYRRRRALAPSLLNLLPILLLVWIADPGDGALWEKVAMFVAANLLVVLLRFPYLFNAYLTIGSGKLTLHRRIGRDRVVPLTSVLRYRLGEQRGFTGRREREVVVYYGAGELRFNVSDLEDEPGFLRTLEAKLGGTGHSLSEEFPDREPGLILKRLERLFN